MPTRTRNLKGIMKDEQNISTVVVVVTALVVLLGIVSSIDVPPWAMPIVGLAIGVGVGYASGYLHRASKSMLEDDNPKNDEAAHAIEALASFLDLAKAPLSAVGTGMADGTKHADAVAAVDKLRAIHGVPSPSGAPTAVPK